MAKVVYYVSSLRETLNKVKERLKKLKKISKNFKKGVDKRKRVWYNN